MTSLAPVSTPLSPVSQREKPVPPLESVAFGRLECTNFDLPCCSNHTCNAPNHLGYDTSHKFGFIANDSSDDGTVPLIDSLEMIAHKCRIKNPNVESWAHAINNKLCDIDIDSMVKIQANLASLNHKLKAPLVFIDPLSMFSASTKLLQLLLLLKPPLTRHPATMVLHSLKLATCGKEQLCLHH
jgi:hypothetical protein